MKLGQKARYPRPQSLLRDIAIVRSAVPMDGEPEFEWRKSFSGTPNLRMKATTNQINWLVDFYCGHFYRAEIDGTVGETWRDMRSVVGYLRNRLHTGPLESDE